MTVLTALYNRILNDFARHTHTDLQHQELDKAGATVHADIDQILSGFDIPWGYRRLKIGYTAWDAVYGMPFNARRTGTEQPPWLPYCRLQYRGFTSNRLRRHPDNAVTESSLTLVSTGGAPVDDLNDYHTDASLQANLAILDWLMEGLITTPESSNIARNREISGIPGAYSNTPFDTLSLDWWAWLSFAEDAVLSYTGTQLDTTRTAFSAADLGTLEVPFIQLQHGNDQPVLSQLFRSTEVYQDDYQRFAENADFWIADHGPMYVVQPSMVRQQDPSVTTADNSAISTRVVTATELAATLRQGTLVCDLHAGVFDGYPNHYVDTDGRPVILEETRVGLCQSIPGFWWMAWT